MQIIDACSKGNLGRFINHSCEPNCQTEKVTVLASTMLHLAAYSPLQIPTALMFHVIYTSSYFNSQSLQCYKNCSSLILEVASVDWWDKQFVNIPWTLFRLAIRRYCISFCHTSEDVFFLCIMFLLWTKPMYRCGHTICSTTELTELIVLNLIIQYRPWLY